MISPDQIDVESELEKLTAEFFRAVSFEEGSLPSYEKLHSLFIEAGLLIKNTGAAPEISSVNQFIEPRLASVRSGKLTRFSEAELSSTTRIFGNVAHRFSAYTKSGLIEGVPIAARGMISTQFVLTPAGWRISAMAWDDERAGILIEELGEPQGEKSVSAAVKLPAGDPTSS